MCHKSSNIGKDCNSPCNTHYIPLYVFIALLCRILSTLAYHSLTSSVASAELSWHGRCVPEPTASAPPRVRLLRAAAWIEEPAGHLTRNLIKIDECLVRIEKVIWGKLMYLTICTGCFNNVVAVEITPCGDIWTKYLGGKLSVFLFCCPRNQWFAVVVKEA